MTKEIIINVIIEPFWVWVVLLLTLGLLAALFGAMLGWLFQPRYVYYYGYSEVGGTSQVSATKKATRKSRKPTLFDKLMRLRKKFQPVERIQRACEWEEHRRFFKSWHHAKYRGYLKRKWGIKLPKGSVIVYKRSGKFAVYHSDSNTYYIINWK